jgi:hypothetical protein
LFPDILSRDTPEGNHAIGEICSSNDSFESARLEFYGGVESHKQVIELTADCSGSAYATFRAVP